MRDKGHIMLLLAVVYICGMLLLVKFLDQEYTTELDIQLIEKTPQGYYFLEPTAEFEPRIYVSPEDLAKWGFLELEVGEWVTGIFDAEGWELEGIES